MHRKMIRVISVFSKIAGLNANIQKVITFLCFTDVQYQNEYFKLHLLYY